MGIQMGRAEGKRVGVTDSRAWGVSVAAGDTVPPGVPQTPCKGAKTLCPWDGHLPRGCGSQDRDK